MADFLQLSSIIGFPAGYYSLSLPRLLFPLAFLLSYIETALCWALYFVGLPDYGDQPDSFSWRDFPEMTSSSVPSVSADTIRDNLPLVAFGKFTERFSESIGDNDMCAVCLSSFEEEDQIRELCNCRHIFHRICLDKWLDHRQTTCPLCRSSLMPWENSE